jgi:nitroreductase
VKAEEINSSLQWRYATKRFDADRKIGDSDWQTLLNSLRLAPSSYGLQPWKFLIVQTPEIRKLLRTVSWNQSQIEDCSHLIVFTTRRTMTEDHINAHTHRTAQTRHLPLEAMENYRQFVIQKILKEMEPGAHLQWNQRQAYIAIGFLLETAALLRIDACPIEGLDPNQYDKILNLKDTEYKTAAAVALGYRHPEDTYQTLAKSRFPEEQVFQYI